MEQTVMGLAKPENTLPTTIDDLSRFVLVGREKLTAVRAEIRAIDKVGLAENVRRQKLQEAQDIAEAVLDIAKTKNVIECIENFRRYVGGNS